MTLLREAQATAAQLKRLEQLRTRLERDRMRQDSRQWVQDRRARTHQLIELGGLVQKAGLVELLEDDRATMLGALLHLADQLHAHGQAEEDPVSLKARWRRRGLRIFDADKQEETPSP